MRERLRANVREYLGDETGWPQERIVDRARVNRLVKPHLLEMSFDKCAYCEMRLDATAFATVDQYRPVAIYPWLACSWDNLLPACQICNGTKKDEFPISGERCLPLTEGVDLERERPLLLDPCTDFPERFLVFASSGIATVHPDHGFTSTDARTRAEVTIGLLALNRTALVEARRRVWEDTHQTLRKLRTLRDNARLLSHIRYLSDLLESHQEFSGVRRFAFASLAARRRHPGHWSSTARDEFNALALRTGAYERVSPIEIHKSRRRTEARMRSHPKTPTAATVTGVLLQQYRSIPRITFSISEVVPPDLKSRVVADIRNEQRREVGWKMLLGENASGKSSVLQAIALALMGKKFYDSCKERYRLSDSLRHGVKQGSIKVHLSTESDPIHLRLKRGTIQWVRGGEGANVFLRGYGATRLLPNPRRTLRSSDLRKLKKVDSLFDSSAPLIDAQEWLRQLDPVQFRNVAISLKDLLDIKKGQGDLQFQRVAKSGRPGKFGLVWRKHFEPLEYFSAGYQAVVALACDIMAGARDVSDMRDFSGIVLLDEVGTNLHPTWRMMILERLGRTFPRMQFIASTHEPLCLRGLGSGEVVVLKRDRARVSLIDSLPSPAGLRVDQLLTSEFFGLHTTTDPDVERDYDAYYGLLARKQASLTPKERAQMEQLRTRLAETTVLGTNRRERMVLDIVDRFLAKEEKRGNAFPKPTKSVVRIVEHALTSIESPDAKS